MSMHLIRSVAVSLGLLVGIVGTVAAAEPLRVELAVPKDFPTGLDTVIVGKLEGNVPPSSTVFRLQSEAHPPVTAQRLGDSDRLCVLTHFGEGQAGQVIEFRATPVEGKAIVHGSKQSEGFWLHDGDRPVLFYQASPKDQDGKSRRANYIHPLYGLDGQTLTQDFPGDHIHHRGIFWAWHQLFVDGKSAGDSWANRDFLSVVREAKLVEQGPVFATLQASVDWTSPQIVDDSGKPRPFVRETTRVRLFRAAKDHQIVDFEIQFQPVDSEVKIGGAENSREYSGFTVRVNPPSGMQIVDGNGVLEKDGIGRVSKWVDVSGRFDGKTTSGVGILNHPSLPEFPPKWLLRHYGMQNVIFPGREPRALPADRPLTLRHRLVIHRGGPVESRLADQQCALEQLGW